MTLDKLVSKVIKEASEACSFAFQGGEPTLIGLDFYRELIFLQSKYKQLFQKKSLIIHNAIQTNGIILDDDWCSFFAEHNFLVGLSIDGNKDIHDLNRIDSTGKGTYNRVLKAARILEKNKVNFNILIVVTRELARRAQQVYRSLVKNGFRYLQFIPCIDDFGVEPGSSQFSLTSTRFAGFLMTIFDEWYKDFSAGRYVSIRHFDNWIHMLKGEPPESCNMVGHCTCYGVVEADGSVYPCDFYVLDQWRLGSIQDNDLTMMLMGEKAQEFIKASTSLAFRCETCKYAYICRGGCRRDRETKTSENIIEANLNIYCDAYFQFFEHALPRMKQIANNIC